VALKLSAHGDSEIILVQKTKGLAEWHSWGAMFVAKYLSFAEHIMKLVDIYGKFFTHKTSLDRTHKKFKGVGKNIELKRAIQEWNFFRFDNWQR
jgi:uncharacterized protein (UPF0276 family)